MRDNDMLRRFSFDGAGVRGELVNLNASWQRVLKCYRYPAPIRNQLGHALAAVVMLSATLKFRGSLILQAQGTGPLHTLVAQATHRRTIRGLARWKGDAEGDVFADLLGSGQLALTISGEAGDRYQGIVDVQGNTLSDALEGYFSQSEQLPTRLWLAADGRCASGLLLQQLPAYRNETENWTRISLLAETVTDVEMMTLSAEQLLYRLFNEERVRMFDPEPVGFRCGCSVKKIESSLAAFGREELTDLVEERGVLEVTCEFCNRRYCFDRVDVEQLLSGSTLSVVSAARH